jgi:hypothetical protein
MTVVPPDSGFQMDPCSGLCHCDWQCGGPPSREYFSQYADIRGGGQPAMGSVLSWRLSRSDGAPLAS